MILQQTLIIEKYLLDITERQGPTTTGFSITMTEIGGGETKTLLTCLFVFSCLHDVHQRFINCT